MYRASKVRHFFDEVNQVFHKLKQTSWPQIYIIRRCICTKSISSPPRNLQLLKLFVFRGFNPRASSTLKFFSRLKFKELPLKNGSEFGKPLKRLLKTERPRRKLVILILSLLQLPPALCPALRKDTQLSSPILQRPHTTLDMTL